VRVDVVLCVCVSRRHPKNGRREGRKEGGRERSRETYLATTRGNLNGHAEVEEDGATDTVFD